MNGNIELIGFIIFCIVIILLIVVGSSKNIWTRFGINLLTGILAFGAISYGAYLILTILN